MSDILFIKSSSLGDVIHHMPALTEVRRARPGARIAWVVEESYAPLVRLHPAVDDVIPVASRRWRGSWFRPGTWREIAAFVRALRAHSYDDVVDSQGLLRSAVIARLARGRRHGYDSASVRERPADALYDICHAVDPALHAIERNRRLTGLALGYVPQGVPDFGLSALRAASPAPQRYGVFLHSTTHRDKTWAEENWIALGRKLAREGRAIVLPWGNEQERARSARLASAIPNARVPEKTPLDEAARLVAGAEFVAGVDTGLTHLAAASGVPLVAIFVASDPALTGPAGQGRIEILGRRGAPPTVEDVANALARVLARA